MVAPAVDDFAQAKGFIAPPGYRPHQPEATLLYRIVAEQCPRDQDQRAAEGKPLPGYVQDPMLPWTEPFDVQRGLLGPDQEASDEVRLAMGLTAFDAANAANRIPNGSRPDSHPSPNLRRRG